MTNKNFNLAETFENSKKAQEMYQKYIDDTYKYIAKYRKDFPEGMKGSWNGSVDAFRHAYMQAHSRYFYGIIKSKGGAWLHEIYGNTYNNQSKEEEFMDKWNNNQGQKIAIEVKNELKNLSKTLTDEDIEDYIAFKVIQKMREGKIVRNIDEAANMMNKKQNQTVKTLQSNRDSVPQDNTSQKMAPDPYKTQSQKFSDEIRQKFKAKDNKSNKRINRILNFHNPNPNLENGHWVTMNGAHVFIEDK